MRSPVRLTLRARLTLVYGGLFVLGGMLLLFLTYSLVANAVPGTGGSTAEFKSELSEIAPLPEDVVLTENRRTIMVGEVWGEALGEITNQGVLALFLVSLATIALGWLIAGRMLRPLQHVTDTAAQIAESPAADKGLHQRIRISGPRDELRELAETFNRMLERLDQSFDGQRAFISNASHELRTPLTVTRALLEVAVLVLLEPRVVRHQALDLLLGRRVVEDPDHLAVEVAHRADPAPLLDRQAEAVVVVGVRPVEAGDRIDVERRIVNGQPLWILTPERKDWSWIGSISVPTRVPHDMESIRESIARGRTANKRRT